MSDNSNSKHTLNDQEATHLTGDLKAMYQTILSQAKIKVPDLETASKKLDAIFEKVQNEKKPIEALASTLFKTLSENKIGKDSDDLFKTNSVAITNLLVYANLMLNKTDVSQREKNQVLYIEKQKELHKKLGNDGFSTLQKKLIKLSSTNNKECSHFALLFHADCSIDSTLKNIGNTANAVHLTGILKDPKSHKKVTFAPDLVGGTSDFNVIDIASKLVQLLVPVDPSKENNVFVVCPELAKLAQDPQKYLQEIEEEKGAEVFQKIKEEILKLNLPEDWKANINVVGDNLGGEIATAVFTAIQQGLKGELKAVPKPLQDAAEKKVKEIAKEKGLGKAVEMTDALGGAKKLVKNVRSLNLGNVQTSPLLNKEFRAKNPEYDDFLGKHKIEQSLGFVSLALKVGKQLGLDKELKKVDTKFQEKYHNYRVVRPGLTLIAKNVMPTLGMAMYGASIGSTVPAIGTGVGALIGLGAGVAKCVFDGYTLWQEKKQEKIEKAAEDSGMEIHAATPKVALTASPTTLTFKNNTKPKPEPKPEHTPKKHNVFKKPRPESQ